VHDLNINLKDVILSTVLPLSETFLVSYYYNNKQQSLCFVP